MSKIECENVTKIFKNCVALDGINLSIPSGQFIAITGESGSGKSTLLSLLSGLDNPTTGSILIDEKDLSRFNVRQIADFRKESIGFIFQQFFLEPNYTVFQNIALPLIIKKYTRKEIEQQVLLISQRIGLEDKLKTKAKCLSGGEMQRCCIARAFVKNPKIIFADEPCGNLDTTNGKVVIDLLKEYQGSGNTVVLVTHNQQEASRAERIIKLKDGKIISDILTTVKRGG